MLRDFEIKALDHNLLNYQEWGAHAVSEGVFPDMETALKYKAKKCAARMINEHESVNAQKITTSKDALLTRASADVEIKRGEFNRELKTKSEEITVKDRVISGLKKQIKENVFFKKVAISAKNKEQEEELTTELLQLNTELELKQTERDAVKNTLDTFLDTTRLEVETLLSNMIIISEQIMEEKVNICHSVPGYKNRLQRKENEGV